MMYSNDEKKRLEKVITIFTEYLRNSPSAELLYSQKAGYVFIRIDSHNRLKSEVEVIGDAVQLCDLLLNEIYLDYCIEVSQEKSDMSAMTDEHIVELRNRLASYKVQLPEYEELFSEYC